MSLAIGMNFGLAVDLAIKGLSGIKNGQDALTRINRVMKGTKDQSDKLRASLEKMDRIDLKMKGVKEQLSNMRSKLTGAIASAGAIAVPVKFAGDLEAAMMDFNDAAGLDPKELEIMGDAMRKIGNASGQTQAQMAELGGVIKRLGVDNKDLVGYLETTSKMQVAMGISTDDMKSHLSTMDAAWKMSSKELERFGDGLFVLQNKFNASASSILKHTARTAASTRKLGLDAASASAMVAAMSKAARGPGQLESAVGDLASGLSGLRGASDSAKAALSSVGLGADFLASAFDADPKKALDLFLEQMHAVAKTDKKKADAVLAEVFGGSGKVVSMLVDSLEQYKEASAEMANSTGQMAAAADDVGNSFNATFGDFYNALKNINTQIGQIFLPYAKMLFAVLRDGAIWASDFIAEHKTLAKVVFGAVGAFAALKVGFFAVKVASLGAQFGIAAFSKQLLFVKNATWLIGGGALKQLHGHLRLVRAGFFKTAASALYFGRTVETNLRFGGVGGSIKMLKSSLLGLAGGLIGKIRAGFTAAALAARGFSLALLTNPIGWLVAAIAGAAVLIIRNIKKVSAFFTGIWEGIKEGVEPLFEAFAPLGEVFTPLGEAIGWVWDKLKAAFGWLLGATEESEEGIKSFGAAGKSVGQVIASAINLITWPLRQIFKLVGAAIDIFVNWRTYAAAVCQMISEAFATLGRKISAIWGAVGDFFTAVGAKISDFYQSVCEFYVGVFRAAVERIKGFFAPLGDFLAAPAQMMKDAFAAAISWVTDKIDWVADKWKKVKGFLGFGGGDESDKKSMSVGGDEKGWHTETSAKTRFFAPPIAKIAAPKMPAMPKMPAIAAPLAGAALATSLAAAPMPQIVATPASATPQQIAAIGQQTTNQNVNVSVNMGEVCINAKDGKFDAEQLAQQVQKAIMAAIERAQRAQKNRSVIDDF